MSDVIHQRIVDSAEAVLGARTPSHSWPLRTKAAIAYLCWVFGEQEQTMTRLLREDSMPLVRLCAKLRIQDEAFDQAVSDLLLKLQLELLS